VDAVVDFIRRAVGMAKKKPVAAPGDDSPGHDVDQMKALFATLQIDAEGKVQAVIVIAQNDGQLGIDRAQFIEDRLMANVAQVPDFIHVPEKVRDGRNPSVMGVGEHPDAIILFVRRNKSLMGQKSNKVQKRRRRLNYKKRLKVKSKTAAATAKTAKA
jgi:hypothetical protein